MLAYNHTTNNRPTDRQPTYIITKRRSYDLKPPQNGLKQCFNLTYCYKFKSEQCLTSITETHLLIIYIDDGKENPLGVRSRSHSISNIKHFSNKRIKTICLSLLFLVWNTCIAFSCILTKWNVFHSQPEWGFV